MLPESVVPGMLPAQAEPVAAERRVPEITGRTAARLLVAAGAVLVVIAATAFTVADWGQVGPLARCAILLAVTALVLAVPRPLVRRGLIATAESVAGIGLAMTLADAYLLHRLALGHSANLLVIAAGCAALTVIWACYGLAARVRVPFLAALGLAQSPLPLAAAGLARGIGGPGYPVGAPLMLALAATCCADVLLTRWVSGREGGDRARAWPVGLPTTAALRALTVLTVATASAAWIAVAVAWVAGSFPATAQTIAELAVLTGMFGVASAAARGTAQVAVCTCAALAAMASLAAAIPSCAGWPARYCGFAVLAVAVLAVGVATRLRRSHPVHARALDLCAGPVVLVAAAMAAQRPDSFAVLAAVVALIASATAWIRSGTGQVIALAGACAAALAAIATEHAALAAAVFSPFTEVAQAWRGNEVAYMHAAQAPGLPLAAVVLAACLFALAAAVGARRGTKYGSLDAVAAALPLIAAPVGLASGFGYGLTVALLLVLTVGLTLWTAFGFGRQAAGEPRTFKGAALAPASAALAAAVLTLAWALAAPVPTLVVLGCLAVLYAVCAVRAPLASVRIGASGLAVATMAAFTGCAALAAGAAAWQSGMVVLLISAVAQLVAWRLLASDGGARRHVALAVEITAWIAAAAGVAACLSAPRAVSLALATAGLICVGVAGRPDRRPALWAGLVLCEVAWCVLLASARVSVPEVYTVPAAMIALAFGWFAVRKNPALSSWACYGLGQAWLLLPSLIMVWHGTGWFRPLALGVVATAVTLLGARFRLQAPLLLGMAAAVLDAGHELAPAVRAVIHWLPGWLPIAVLGAVLLWAGATYEARLANLGRLRRSLGAMR